MLRKVNETDKVSLSMSFLPATTAATASLARAACRECDRDNPDGRVVSRACLHVVCGECAEFAYEACPICRYCNVSLELFIVP